MRKSFGTELLLDLYNCEHSAMNDLRLCYDFLEEAVQVLGVTKQAPPFLFQSPEKGFEDKAGLSGWIPLIESGIQLHTLSLKNFVSIDYYTCGVIDEVMEDKLIALARNTFSAGVTESQLIDRGRSYYT